MPLLPAPPAPRGNPLSADSYGNALAGAYTTVRHARSDGTHALQGRVAAAYSRFLGSLPRSLNKSFATTTAHDVLVFLHSEWRPRHGRTALTDGTTVASATGMGNAIAALSTTFIILGRRGEWDPHLNQGNPCESHEVRRYRSGYHRELWDEWIEPIAATPLCEDKLLALVTHLDAKRAQHSLQLTDDSGRYAQLRVLLLERDALLFTYLGASIQRGGEGARLRVCDVRSTQVDGIAGVSMPLGNALPINEQVPPLTIHPNGVKSRQRRDCGHFDLLPHADPRLCFASRLSKFTAHCSALGFPLQSPAGFIFRIMDSHDRTRLAEIPLSVSAGQSRLRAGLKSLGDYNGESMHSFRRAGMQADQAAGVSQPVTMKRALIVTSSSYNRYTDLRRPTKATKHGPLPK